MRKNRIFAMLWAMIVALAAFGCKTETETEYVDKKADETAPADVKDLAAQAKDSRVLLTWTDAADDDVYGYEVTYSGTKPINRVVFPALDSKTMMAGKGSGGCYVSGLENGTEYTFAVKTVDTSGNKSEGVNVKATPVADASEPLKIELAAAVPQENGYTGNKSNTKVTVTAKITTASKVKKVVWKKNGSLIAKSLLADEEAKVAAPTENDAVWIFDITATNETANDTYTVAAIDEAGREEAEQITIDNFDFTAPGKVKVPTKPVYSSDLSSIIINWIEPDDADYDHVDITFTSNDGISNSDPSEAVTIEKGTLTKTFSDIDGAKAYYTYTFVTYDELGNKGAEYIRLVSLNKAISNIPEGFVEVPGIAITGTETWTPSSRVFLDGRQFTIPDLIVSDHEVTQAEWKDVMGTTPSGMVPADGNADNNPVNMVNWYDALVYCNKRSIKERLTPCYTINGSTDPNDWGDVPTSSDNTWAAATCDWNANGYRLPTEAEWEWAARGGENYKYAGSDDIKEVAWYDTTGTREVKTKKANGYGLYDMSGNVREWCWDRWSGTISSDTPITGASSGSRRILRGGGCYDYGYDCEVACKNYIDPYYRANIFGFRVVRSAH